MKRRRFWLPFFFSAQLFSLYGEGLYEEEDCIPCCELCECTPVFGAKGGWVYLRPLTSEIPYARRDQVADFVNQSGQIIDSRLFCFDTAYSQGFELFAFLRNTGCEDSGWDLEASFLSHYMKNKEWISFDPPQVLIPQMGLILEVPVNTFSSAATSIKTDLNVLNGEFGGVIDRKGSYFLRFFAGVQYAEIKQKLKVEYSGVVESGFSTSTGTSVTEFSHFSGIGPRIGVEGSLPLLCNLSLFGDFALNLLFSKKEGRFDQKTVIDSTDLQDQLRLCQKFCNARILAPSGEARLGLALTFDVCGLFSIGLQGGYRALHYWDALFHMDIVSNRLFGIFDRAVFEQSATLERSLNFGLSGWFFDGSLTF